MGKKFSQLCTSQAGWRNFPNLSQQEVVTLQNGRPVYRYIRLYDRLAPSILLISARGAKMSWILRHTKLSDFCAFAW